MTAPYYADDQVTLYHGDCREVTEWLAADVLVTDPPYGIGWKSGQTSYTARNARVESIHGDESTQVRDAALALWGNRKPAVVFGTWRQPRPQQISHRLIWHKAKTPPGVSSSAYYAAEEEVYLIGSGWTGKPIQNVIVTNEWRASAHGFVARSGHPTPKPESLMSVLIGKCPPGVIADPFAGSGTTLVVARNLGRKAIGVEIEERYCELAARRLAQQTLKYGAQ
jgi:DNA modification methylase